MAMCAFDDRLDIDTIRAAERNVRQRNQTRGVIDRLQNIFQPDGDAIIGMHGFDRRADSRLRVPDVLHRGKIERAGNDFVPFITIEIKTRSHARKGNRGIRLNLH